MEQVGLILPTSLCAGQIARLATDYLNQKGLGQDQALSRFVALVHTEGCGASGGTSEDLYVRTMLGYLAHPMVKHCLLLEHGCEKTHNDYMRNHMVERGLDPNKLGWASVQLDGGIDSVLQKVEAWFADSLAQAPVPQKGQAGLEGLRLGLASIGELPTTVAQRLGIMTSQIVAAGGSVVLPQNTGMLSHPTYLGATLGEQPAMPTLAYGDPMQSPGFHVMETPTAHWVETLTGLGASGVDLIVVYVGEHPVQTHPMIPVLQITADEGVQVRYGADLDLVIDENEAWVEQLYQRMAALSAQEYSPKLYDQGNIDFQLTRGLLGISL
jgi:altronate dehydratase